MSTGVTLDLPSEMPSGTPMGPSVASRFGQLRGAGVVEAHPVDDRFGLLSRNSRGRGLPGLRVRGHRADLDEAETQCGPGLQRNAVLVHAGGQADRGREIDAEHACAAPGVPVRIVPSTATAALRPGHPGQRAQRAVVRGLRVALAHPEQHRPGQPCR